MILVIDTSSSRSALAVVGGRDLIFGSREPIPLSALVSDPGEVEKVVIATGPGSFTGLRRGAAFGIGLAMGLRVPLVPVATLELQAARAGGRMTAVSEAGRGRYYYSEPGGGVELGGPDEISREHQLVGLLSIASQTTLEGHGHRIAGDGEVQTVGRAAEALLKSAPEVPYGSVKLEYMQSFGAKF